MPFLGFASLLTAHGQCHWPFVNAPNRMHLVPYTEWNWCSNPTHHKYWMNNLLKTTLPVFRNLGIDKPIPIKPHKEHIHFHGDKPLI